MNMHHSLSVPDVLQLLRASTADARSDAVLAQLLRFRSKWPAFADSVLVLAFVPMLHRTIRRVIAYQSSLAEEDVVQQTLEILLQVLDSDDLRVRQSHFAFAISRAVKREVFAWAAREGLKQSMLTQSSDAFPQLETDEPFERHTQLRHFLHRCITRGDLSSSELDLLIQFKLDATNGNGLHSSNGHASNAERQKLKRLLAKLRRLAR
ncbi:MAG TPA: hypothetical protein VN982_13190 [Candidatus Dormibacteraeota bacterium]|nr:hypothetical protein [Candidatus Dormibacteraeota bacterium]